MLFSVNLFGQQIPLSNQYAINKSAIIPAFSGYNGNIESFLSYRNGWIGIQGAPTSALLNINGALNDDMGFGFSAITEKSGNFNQNFLNLTYSYHLKFGSNMVLSAGISPMYYRNYLNLSTIQSYGTQFDPMLLNTDNLKIDAFDIGVSFGFSAAGFRTGVSVPQTIGMTFNFDELGSTFGLKRHFFGYLSYLYKTDNWGIEPMAIVRSTEKSPVNYAGSVIVKYKDKVWTNIGYSADNSIILSVGVLSGSSLALNYSYELGIGGISGASFGTHEITVGFLIKSAQTFKPEATVFLPLQPVDGIVQDANLSAKVAALEAQVKRNKQDGMAIDVDLQRQIDSLKNLLGNQVITQNNGNQTNVAIWQQRVVSQSVTFGLMNDRILSSSFSELDKYTQKLRADSDLKIKIEVYTDNMFSEQINMQLSQDRAKSVADYFLSKPGISASQIEFVGMGSINPIADNTTPEGKEQNNRVEFLLSKKVF
ncbi:MAG: PorP/SprF family type IX secretion system membrane protein [Bacteroidales bacterium]|nr:PorP/SprF family type IX secretion system membrane protein [Bacteroidales bacterium]